jgi:predicted DNA binding CopG/RHH family protein
MSDLLDIPHFDTEEEEADWWFQNQDTIEAAFERAEREGRLKRGSEAVKAVFRPKGAITVRMSETDLHTLRERASREGQEEESYAAALLHEALEKSA